MATFRERLGNAAAGTKGSKRMLIVIGGAALIAGSAYFLTASAPPPPMSDLRNPGSGVRITVQGERPVSPEYNTALETADRARVTTAAERGLSAIPTIRATESQPAERPDESGNRQGDFDGVNRPAPPVIAPPQIVAPIAPIAPPPIQVAQAPIEIDPMVGDMVRRLEMAKPAYPPAKVDFYSKPTAPADLSGLQAQVAGGAVSGLLQTNGGIRLPLPGTIVYAEMISSANSDSPGPVIARIAQGELAGATLIGSFQTQRDALVITFQTLSMENNREGDEINKSIPINAVGVDTSNIGTGLATSVDRHLLQNVGIMAAAAFAQGLGSAISQSGQQVTQSLGGVTVTNPLRSTRDQLYIAGGVAGGAAGQALQQAYGNRPVTVKVAAGTPVGILFLPNRNF